MSALAAVKTKKSGVPLLFIIAQATKRPIMAG